MLKLKYDELLSSLPFKFNLRRYTGGLYGDAFGAYGRAVQVAPIKTTLIARQDLSA